MPPRYVLSIGDAPKKAFYEVIEKGGVNEYAHFNNNVKAGDEPVLVATNTPERYGKPRDGAGGESPTGRDGGRDTGADQPSGQPQTGRANPVADVDIPTGIAFDAEGNMRVTLTKSSDILQDIADDDDLVSAVTRCAI